MQKYNIIVFGAGGVGAYYGGRLACNSNNNVIFITRGKHLDALQKNGIVVHSIDGDFSMPVNASDTLDNDLPVADLIIIAVKSYDTDDAIGTIRGKVGLSTQILTIQNGIENYPKFVQEFGQDNVIEGYCAIGVEVTAPGIISHTYYGTIIFGEYNGTDSSRIKRLKTLFDKCNIKYHISPDIRHDVWKKFAWNCIFNILTTITGTTLDNIYNHPQTIQLCKNCFKEIQLVAKSQGVILTDTDQDWVINVARSSKLLKTSTLQDRLRNKRLEYETFTGTIIRLAQASGIDVPINTVLYGLLKAVDIYDKKPV